jgi:hypothetical protein
LFDLLTDTHAVGFIAQAQQRKDDDVFELAQALSIRHFYNVEEIF